jgi:hypothetical protein
MGQTASADSLIAELQQGVSLRHAVVPIYTDPPRELMLVVRVNAAFMDYERRGFFHIGMLPVAVLDGVTFEPQQPVLSAQVLDSLGHVLGVDSRNHAELRRVKFMAGPGRLLEADRVRCAPDGTWRLLGAVRLQQDDREIRAARGALYLTGKRAGLLVLDTTPRSIVNFLSVTEVNQQTLNTHE